MQPRLSSSAFIQALAIWLALSTSAIAAFDLAAAPPNTRVHPVDVHFPPIPPGT